MPDVILAPLIVWWVWWFMDPLLQVDHKFCREQLAVLFQWPQWKQLQQLKKDVVQQKHDLSLLSAMVGSSNSFYETFHIYLLSPPI